MESTSRCLVAAVYFIVVLISAMALHRLAEMPCPEALKTFSFTRWSNIFNEGVCGNAIEAGCHGSWAMPFLRDLRSRSMYFRITAFH